MIKGVNRQIIEITETGNAYYEKAFLIIKPEYNRIQRDILEKEAKNVLNKLGKPGYIKKSSRFVYWFLRLSCSALLGAITTIIVLNLQ